MSQTDDRRDKKLPITAEVGSEGGSFADATTQVPTFSGDIRRTSGNGDPPAVATHATTSGPMGSSPGNPEGGMVRYPTEPPSPPTAAEGWRAGLDHWRAAAIGLAAGAALGFGISRLRRRRTAADNHGPGGLASHGGE
jgi:hypothetical protein